MQHRHYIFIDPTDVGADIHAHKTLGEIKRIHAKYYINGEVIQYHSYNDISKLLESFDIELKQLFLQINTNYPALLAAIGRLVILYYYGGIYHDLKCVSTKALDAYLDTVADKDLICEEHPTVKHRVRNTNIVALKTHSPFIATVLQKIKIKLLASKDAFGPDQMFSIDSIIFITEFAKNKNNTIIKYPFINTNMIVFDNDIYKKRITRWQRTYESIFKPFVSHATNH
jgi:signal recognition particle subunit SEC65